MVQSDFETIRSVEIACSVIETLQELDGGGITEISNRTGHSKSTIYNHLQTLEENQLAAKEGDQYRLSVRFLDVASHVRNQSGNYDVIRDELDKAAKETGEVVQFGVEEHEKVGYLYKAQGNRAVQTISSVGTYQPMHSTALGKALLAEFSNERVHEILDQGWNSGRRTQSPVARNYSRNWRTFATGGTPSTIKRTFVVSDASAPLSVGTIPSSAQSASRGRQVGSIRIGSTKSYRNS